VLPLSPSPPTSMAPFPLASTLAAVAAAALALAAHGAPTSTGARALESHAKGLEQWLAKKAQSSKTMVGVSAFVVSGSGEPLVATAGSATLPRAYDKTSKRATVAAPGSKAAAVSPATGFMLASVSKTVTWTALTMLLDQGKFALDDAIDGALPFKVRNPKFSEAPITYRHLYTHTSGMKDDWTTYRYGDACPPTAPYMTALATSLANHVAKPSSWAPHAPGKKYKYSNFASSLAAVLVERHSGMEFTAFTQSFIFQPLGMARTSWFRPTDGTAAGTYTYKVRKGIKTRYDTRAGGYCYADWPSGQLWSTAGDMARFSAAMLAYGRFGTATDTANSNGAPSCLYSTATGRLAFEVASPSTGDGDSALGWFSGDYYAGGVGHDGSEEGVSADLFVKTKSIVAVGWMANSELSNAEYQQLNAKLIEVAEAIGPMTSLPSPQGACVPVLTKGTAPATTKKPVVVAPATTKKPGAVATTKRPVVTTPARTCTDSKPDLCARRLKSPKQLTRLCKKRHVRKKCQQMCSLC